MNPDPASPGAASPTVASRVPLLVAASAVVVALGVGAFFLLRGGASAPGTPAANLAGTLPASVDWAVLVDAQRLSAYPVLKRQLDKAPAQQALSWVQQRYGLDVRGLQGVAFGLQVSDETAEFLLVGQLPIDPPVFDAALQALVGPGTREVAGRRFHALPMGKRLDAYLPAGFGGESEADAPALPLVPDLLIGPAGEGRVLAGTAGLVSAYLGGGKTVADDAELGPRLAAMPPESFVAGAVRAGESNPLSTLLRRERRRLVGADAGTEPPPLPNLLCTFELHFEGNRLVGSGVYDFEDDAAAARAKEQMRRSFTDVRAQLSGLKLDLALGQKGASVTIRVSVELPVRE